MNSFEPWTLLLMMHVSISIPSFFLSTILILVSGLHILTLLSEEENTPCRENESSLISKVPSVDLLNLVTEQEWLYKRNGC